MSLLAIFLKPRDRLEGAQAAMPTTTAAALPEWRFVFSRDGHSVDRRGQARTDAWPSADRVVVVVDELDVAWLRGRVPRVRSSRLQPVLQGLLEDDVLTDLGRTHLALGPTVSDARDEYWIAAVERPWLQTQLDGLAQSGVSVDAVVCASEPTPTTQCHVRQGVNGQIECVASGPEGVAVWPMPLPAGVQEAFTQCEWTAEPAASPSLLDHHRIRASLQDADQRGLNAARGGTNLLQFDLAPRARASRLLAQGWTMVTDRSWRAVQFGVLALVAVQVIGLNFAAREARQSTAAIEQRTTDLLQSTFPSVKVVVDAPVQMERELQSLRAAAGRPSSSDLETWLDLAAPLWGPGSPPLKSIQLKGGVWALETDGREWPPSIVQALEQHASSIGWTIRVEGSRVLLAASKAKG